MLARRKGSARNAVDEQLEAGLAMLGGEPHVIGRALIAERRRHRIVHRESPSPNASRNCASVPGHSWLRCGMVRRLATVRWRSPSAGVGRGRHRCRIRGPHRRGRQRIRRHRRSESSTVVPSSASQDGLAVDEGRTFPAPARVRGWRAFSRCPAAPRLAAARPVPALRVDARLPKLSPA